MKLTNKFAALLVGATLLSLAAPLELRLKQKDHEALGKDVRAYYEALDKKEGISAAKNDLGEAIQKLNQKLSKKAKEEVDLLASPGDLAAIFAASAEYPKRSTVGRVTEFSADTFFGVPVEYALHAPKSYKASKGAVPLIVVIPKEQAETGKKGGPARQLDEDWMLGDLRDGAVIAVLKMPEDPGTWGTRGDEGQLGGLETMMFALRQIRQDYRIDPDQIFLAGEGAGVAAAAELANVFPYIFAGLVGRTGDLGATAPTNFRNLPSYFTGGGSGVTDFADKAAKLGYENVTVKPDGTLEDVWAWIKDTRRNANPAALTLAPAADLGGGCYWLEASGFDVDAEQKPEVTAEIDREKNAIAITAKGISAVTLMFNDSMIDLDREVLVICNGVEHKDRFVRTLSTALDQFFRSNDSGRIYTAYQAYDIPEGSTD